MVDEVLSSEDSVSKQFWQEDDSAHFIDLGRIYTPRRDEIEATFLDLMPAEDGDEFTGVELGTGQGWLTTAILRRFRNARMIGLDGSETMLRATRELVGEHGDRVDLRLFRLEERVWREQLPSGLRCVVSSLVVHHLDGPGKAALFSELFARLEPGGALLINDVMAPANEWARWQMARAWNREVERQSREIGGDERAFRQFVADRWNFYEFPDPEDEVDKPSTLVEQLGWMADAGFTGVDVFWARAGHVLFGGYKPDDDR